MAQDTDLLAILLRTAGHRAAPPRHVYEATRAAAQAALERKLRVHAQRRIALKAAAGLLLVTGLVALLMTVGHEPAVPAAEVTRIIGAADRIAPTDGVWRPLDDTALTAGTQVRTRAASGLALTLGDGTSLRLAADTHIEILASGAVRLASGKLYADSGDESAEASTLRIITAVGITRDLGTQFEVRFRDGEYRLRVREGRVVLVRDREELRSRAGEELTLASSGAVSRTRIATHSPEWQWAQELAPPPKIDGEPLGVLLDWVARETGREIRYASPDLADRVRITILHGHFTGLAPLDALAVMLGTTNFEYVLEDDGTILIRTRDLPPRGP